MSDYSEIFGILGLIFCLLFVGYMFYGLLVLAFAGLRGITDPFLPAFYSLTGRQPASRYRGYLEGSFSYYNKLTAPKKILFLLRVAQFNRYKSYEGRKGLEVTDEMKALVAASAVQLTFGLKKFSLSHFDTIILYPEEYYSERTEHYHLGETNIRGIIVLSWADLRDGYAHADDDVNVGLHEMAHALELQTILKRDYDEFFGNYFARWSQEAQETFENVQDERSNFLRKYAGTNKREFFAVCVEYFFESPVEFRQHLPQVYKHLSLLLNQDPLRSDGTVEELPFKTAEELLPDTEARQPLLRTRLSFASAVFQILYLALAVVLMAVQGLKDLNGFILFMACLGLLFSVVMVFKMKRILLYDKCMVVKHVLWGSDRFYAYEDIVAVQMPARREGQYIQVLLSRNGRILKKRHFYFTGTEDQEEMEKILREKGIPLRSV